MSVVKLRRAGFTLIELLVVIAIIGILASILLPVLSRAKMRAVAASCMSNNKQLCLAWLMYAGDNSDNLAINSDPHISNFYLGTPTWVTGTIDWTTGQENTNTTHLIDSAHSLLGTCL